MLFDPKWEVQSKPDVFSLEGLIAWLETMPVDGKYSYFANCGCMFHQYFTAMGTTDLDWVGGWEIHLKDGSEVPLSEDFGFVAVKYPHTFGAALTRARSSLALQRGE